jgi:hypothetical protein
MRRWGLALLWLGGALATFAAAEPGFRISQKGVREEVRTVVTAQLTALARGDFEAAYAHAAEGIKRQFDVRLFAAMIRRGYPRLLRQESADVGIVRDNGAGAAQVIVTVTDPLHRASVYRYWLVREEAGWKISGVVVEQRPSRGDI